MAASRQAYIALLCVFGSLMLVNCGRENHLPKDKSTYTITSWNMQSYPLCPNKYLSAPSCDNMVRPVFQDLVAGFNKDWTFNLVPGSNDTFYISNYRCKKYLSVRGCDKGPEIYLWDSAGPNQQFQLVPTVRSTADKGEYTFKAVARAGKCKEWMGFQVDEIHSSVKRCNPNVDLQSAVEYIAGGHSGGSRQAFWVTP